MTIAIYFFVVGSVLAGFAITLLSGLTLTIEERLFFGAVIGLMVVTAATFGFFLAFGLGPLTLGLGFGFTAGLGAVGLLTGWAGLTTELREFKDRWTSHPRSNGHPWALWLLLLISWTYTLHFFSQAYVLDDHGLTAGYINIWGDWGAHLSYAGSFAYGDNRPPEFFIDPGHRLGYAFAIDFLAAMMVHLGATLPSALVISSAVLALAFPGVMYCAGLRLVKSRAAAALAVPVFAMMGGTGFIYFMADIDNHGMTALTSPSREYTLNRDLGYQWLDPVLAYLVPQRSVLFGFSLILISAALLWIAKEDQDPEKSGWRKAIRPRVFVGVVVGLTPVFHPYAYATAIALGGFWALMDRTRTGIWWRDWLRGFRSQLAFFVPALALGMPALLWLLPANGGDTVHFQPGWYALPRAPSVPLADLPDWLWNWLAGGLPGLNAVNALAWCWFWIKNISLFLPLLLIAQLWKGAVPDRFRRRFMPLWLWFLVPNLFVFQPWEWDNTKFFVFWALFGSILVAALVVRIAATGVAGRVLAASCVVCLVLAGGIDLYRASNYSVSSQNLQFTDAGGVRIAAWARDNTDRQATFLVAHEHNNPVMALAGRRVVLGYPSWLFSYGIDYSTRQPDVERMLRGDPQTPELVRRYHVDYVVIGPQERSDQYHANVAYWRANATQVREDGDYRVFKTGTMPDVRGASTPTADELSLSGAHDLKHRCISLGYKDAGAASGKWMCRGKADGRPDAQVDSLLDINAACVWAYGSAATALQKDPSNPNSWVCVRRE